MYTDHTDEQLAQLLSRSDEGAFREIYDRYWKWLLYLAHKRLRNTEDAREVVQNVFLNLWKKRDNISIQFLPQYLAAMTRYAVYRYLANEDRRAEVYSMAEMAAGQEKSECPDIENKYLLDILIRYAGDSLPEKYSLVFIQHKLQDKPLPEVAARLGVSPRTAERYVTQVMSLIRKQLGHLRSLW
jgi:RNA polymerase sigma-70 factor (ECF subfamily)